MCIFIRHVYTPIAHNICNAQVLCLHFGPEYLFLVTVLRKRTLLSDGFMLLWPLALSWRPAAGCR